MGKPGLTFFPLLAALLVPAGCGGRVYVVSSLGPPHTVVVDGETDDWNGALSYVEKSHLFVGFINNRDNLYICLTREEVEGRAAGAPMSGLTVWLDPAGGEKKTLGIRLAQAGGPPEGEQPEGAPGQRPGSRPERQPRNEAGDRGADQDKPPMPPGGGIEILGSNGQVLRKMSSEEAAAAGLEVKTGFAAGSSTVEIGIPLVAGDRHPYAVGAGPDGAVGIGFISRKSSRNDRRGGPSEGGPGGGMPGGMGGGMPGGMGGGMGGPGGGMRPDMNPDVANGFKIWVRVKLANSSWPQPSGVLEIQ